jgi:hypothetical protein
MSSNSNTSIKFPEIWDSQEYVVWKQWNFIQKIKLSRLFFKPGKEFRDNAINYTAGILKNSGQPFENSLQNQYKKKAKNSIKSWVTIFYNIIITGILFF